jgi:hypothetical protein
LGLAAVAADDLRPRQRHELRHAQASEVGDLQQQTIAAVFGVLDQIANLQLAEDALRYLPGRLPELDERRRIEAREADAVYEPHKDFTAATYVLTLAGFTMDPSSLRRIASRAASGSATLGGILRCAPGTARRGPDRVRRAVGVGFEPYLQKLFVCPGALVCGRSKSDFVGAYTENPLENRRTSLLQNRLARVPRSPIQKCVDLG